MWKIRIGKSIWNPLCNIWLLRGSRVVSAAWRVSQKDHYCICWESLNNIELLLFFPHSFIAGLKGIKARRPWSDWYHTAFLIPCSLHKVIPETEVEWGALGHHCPRTLIFMLWRNRCTTAPDPIWQQLTPQLLNFLGIRQNSNLHFNSFRYITWAHKYC